MKRFNLLKICLGLCLKTFSFGEEPQQDQIQIKPLQLDQLKFITDDNGKVVVPTILSLKVGDLIRIRLFNGKEVLGKVNLREEAHKEYIKIYGDILDKNETAGFGFVALYEGVLAGALLYKNTQKVFTLRYNEEAKAFVFEQDFFKGKSSSPI